MTVVVRVRELVQGYGRRRVLDGFSLDIGVGVLGLLGPNGAGKTTLLRTVATVTPPMAGALQIFGTTVDSEGQALAVRPGIGYLPQDFGFFPSFSVTDFVHYCAWLRGVPKGRAVQATADAIEAVGLSDRATSKMKALSGGMLRRAGIASAIVGGPQLLLLDEPTVGLDPAQRLDFRNLIRSLRGTAVVLSTHLVEDVAAICDEVAVIEAGVLRFQGTPQALAGTASDGSVGDSPLEKGYMTVLSQRTESLR